MAQARMQDLDDLISLGTGNDYEVVMGLAL